MQGRSFALVAINPNNPDGTTSEELGFGKYTDSFKDMIPCAREQGRQFPQPPQRCSAGGGARLWLPGDAARRAEDDRSRGAAREPLPVHQRVNG
jgi:hypothetical protein